MMRKLNNLSPVLIATQGAIVRWVLLAGSAALGLAVFGLEIWLRVPVRPVLSQLLASRREAPTGRPDSRACRLWAHA